MNITSHCTPSFHLTHANLPQTYQGLSENLRGSRFGRKPLSPSLGGDNPAQNIYQRYLTPDGLMPLTKGAPLPRPYGPRNNLAIPKLGLTSYGRKNMKSRRFRKKNLSHRFGEKILLTLPNTKPIPYSQVNVPLQFRDNQLNSLTHLYGRKKKRRSYNKFGNQPNLYSMMGPNNVAYQPNIPLYHGGGTTVNWTTQQWYRPPGLVGNLEKVGPDGVTPKAWLGDSIGIKQASGRPNGARGLTHKGLGYGNLIYNTLDVGGGGGGLFTIKQPLPPRFRKFGRKFSKKPSKLSTVYGGKTITLDKNGKITIN